MCMDFNSILDISLSYPDVIFLIKLINTMESTV